MFVLIYDGCSIRDITKEVAAAVVREAVAEDLAEGYRDMDPQELKKLTQVNSHFILFCDSNSESSNWFTLVVAPQILGRNCGICQEEHVGTPLSNLGLQKGVIITLSISEGKFYSGPTNTLCGIIELLTFRWSFSGKLSSRRTDHFFPVCTSINAILLQWDSRSAGSFFLWELLLHICKFEGFYGYEYHVCYNCT